VRRSIPDGDRLSAWITTDKDRFSKGYDGFSRRNFLVVIGAAGATLADYERVTVAADARRHCCHRSHAGQLIDILNSPMAKAVLAGIGPCGQVHDGSVAKGVAWRWAADARFGPVPTRSPAD